MEPQKTEIKDKYGKVYSVQGVQPEEAEELMAFVRQASEESPFFPWSKEGCPLLWENPGDYIRFFRNSPRQALIQLRDGDKIVGLSELAYLSDEPGYRHRFSLGTGLLKSYWGRELVLPLLSVGEKLGLSLGYEQVEGCIDSRNKRSRSAAEKNGYKICGIMPKYYKHDDGSYSDNYLFVKRLTEDNE